MKLSLALIASALTTLQTAAAADPAAWSLTGERGNEVVLLGSVHYLRAEDYPLPERIERLYAEADRLVMEIDLDDIDPRELQSRLLAAAMLPPDSGLRDVLDPAVYALAETKARELGIDLGMLDRFEPWLVAITMLDLGMARLGYRPDRGLEQQLLGWAARDGKPITGLETIATQIGVFEGLGSRDQQALLEQTLGELDNADAVMGDMIAAWREGELESLAASLMGEFDEFPGLYDSLVVDRNSAWVAGIEALLAEDADYLVVIGALHLVGQDSLVELLEARGIDVNPIE